MYVPHGAMYKVPIIIIRVSQSAKTTAMQQMQNRLEIRISQRGRFPLRETLNGMGTTGCKCRSSFRDHGIIGKSVEAV